MKKCPFCGGPGAVRYAARGGQPFVECTTAHCGAASKPAPTEEGAISNWATRVRAAEKIPNDWGLHAPPFSQAA